MTGVTFKSTLEKIPEKGGWHYIRITPEIRDKLRELSGKNGNVPVIATVGKTSWPSTTMSMGHQRWFIAIKAGVRKAETLTEGNILTITLTPDSKRLRRS